jgi:TFIIIC subunit triple barrel domain
MSVDMHVVLQVPSDVAAKLGSGTVFDLSGMDSSQPTLVVDGVAMVGHFEDIVGTDLAFDPSLAAATPPPRNGGLVATTTKRLVFERMSSE